MPSARFFGALAAVSAAVIYGYSEPLPPPLSLTPVLRLPAFSTPLLQAPACLAQPLSKTYELLPPGLNDLLCTINTVFFSAGATAGGRAFMSYFGGLFVAATLVAVYESFRPSSRRSASKNANGAAEGFGMHLGLAQLATPALALGQIITAGVALPIYYAAAIWSTPKFWRQHTHKVDLGDEVFLPREERHNRKPHTHGAQYNANIPRSSFLYTTVISTLVGLVLPSLWMAKSPLEGKYDATSLWQPFPLYMLTINLLLPPLLRRSFSHVGPMRGVLLIAALGIAVSLKSHIELVTHLDTVPLKSVFLHWRDKSLWNPEALDSASHLLLLVDFFFVFLTTGAKVVLTLAKKSGNVAGGTIKYTLALIVGSAVAGPGAAIMAIWAYGEWVALQAARAFEANRVVVDKGKAKAVKKRQ